MLVDEHADGDAAGVEAIQEVLDVVVGDGVLLAEGVFVFDHPLGHGGDDLVVAVPDVLEDLHKPGWTDGWAEQSGRVRRAQVGLQGRSVVLLVFAATLTFPGLCGHRGSYPGTPRVPSGSACTWGNTQSTIWSTVSLELLYKSYPTTDSRLLFIKVM